MLYYKAGLAVAAAQPRPARLGGRTAWSGVWGVWEQKLAKVQDGLAACHPYCGGDLFTHS